MIKKRNMWLQVLYTILTFGIIYPIYWFHVTNREMSDYKNRNDPTALWTILFIIPFVNWIAYWKQSHLFDDVTNGRYQWPIVFVVWIFFSPGSWFITQYELNRIASGTEDQSVPYSTE